MTSFSGTITSFSSLVLYSGENLVVLKGGAVQNSVKWCKVMENGRTVQNGAKNYGRWSELCKWPKVAQSGAQWLKVMQMVQSGAKWCIVMHKGSQWCKWF